MPSFFSSVHWQGPAPSAPLEGRDGRHTLLHDGGEGIKLTEHVLIEFLEGGDGDAFVKTRRFTHGNRHKRDRWLCYQNDCDM